MPLAGRLVILKLVIELSSASLPLRVVTWTVAEPPGLACVDVTSLVLGSCSMPKFCPPSELVTSTATIRPFGLASGAPLEFSPVVTQLVGRVAAGAAPPGVPAVLESCKM